MPSAPRQARKWASRPARGPVALSHAEQLGGVEHVVVEGEVADRQHADPGVGAGDQVVGADR